jgi:hypothetical protein
MPGKHPYSWYSMPDKHHHLVTAWPGTLLLLMKHAWWFVLVKHVWWASLFMVTCPGTACLVSIPISGEHVWWLALVQHVWWASLFLVNMPGDFPWYSISGEASLFLVNMPCDWPWYIMSGEHPYFWWTCLVTFPGSACLVSIPISCEHAWWLALVQHVWWGIPISGEHAWWLSLVQHVWWASLFLVNMPGDLPGNLPWYNMSGEHPYFWWLCLVTCPGTACLVSIPISGEHAWWLALVQHVWWTSLFLVNKPGDLPWYSMSSEHPYFW